jgi:hypothetical protein
MSWIPVLLFLVVTGVALLVLSAVFAEPITLRIRRYFPGVQFEEEGFLLWGLLISAAFVTGLVVMYLLLRL